MMDPHPSEAICVEDMFDVSACCAAASRISSCSASGINVLRRVPKSRGNVYLEKSEGSFHAFSFHPFGHCFQLSTTLRLGSSTNDEINLHSFLLLSA